MLITKMMKLYQEKTGKDPISYADFENGISSYIEGPSKDYLDWVETLAELGVTRGVLFEKDLKE